jgi:hypothetical protein
VRLSLGKPRLSKAFWLTHFGYRAWRAAVFKSVK